MLENVHASDLVPPAVVLLLHDGFACNTGPLPRKMAALYSYRFGVRGFHVQQMWRYHFYGNGLAGLRIS